MHQESDVDLFVSRYDSQLVMTSYDVPQDAPRKIADSDFDLELVIAQQKFVKTVLMNNGDQAMLPQAESS